MLLKLFISFFKIGAMAFGGGLAAISLIQNEIVINNGWISLTEFTDLVTIAEMTPGPIAINAATFVGMRIAGFKGALAATMGCIVPSCIIVSILAFIYFKYKNMAVMQGILKGIRPAVAAMIASAGITILVLALFGEGGFKPALESVNLVAGGLFVLALAGLRKFKLSPILIIFLSGAIGGMIYLL
ncbi:MAG: chromate transporter [Oscillospiraceae bacterium]